MALVPGSFNSDIPGFQIKFEEKYGEEENLLKKVLIYDLTGGNGNQKVITAEKGKILSEEGSRYMTLILYDGFYYEEHVKSAKTSLKKKKMAASNASFKEYEFNIDISSVTGEDDLDKTNHTKNYMMLSLGQLGDTIPNLKASYDETLLIKSKNIYSATAAKDLYAYPDSLKSKNIDLNIIENFDLDSKINILNSAASKTGRALSSLKNNASSIKWKRKNLNFFDTEYYNRIAFSLSCLILFFIGAPLGSIIRKGGFGLPMILAIAIYVTYFFSNTFGKNLAEESSISAFWGAWIAALIMVPLGILLTRRATKDKGLFNIDIITQPILNFLQKLFSKKAT